MKYLLQALESRPGKVGLSDQELKQLLSDVKDGREAKGSDDWYESLEKVVNELRSTTEAHWFLKPVSKKDVKDYHTIVTNPMDLGTVLKKVKAHVYKSKSEFKADIDLIWDNCLLYNTSTTHPIRQQAIQMKRKADHHLEFLVDAAASHEDPLASLGMGKDDEDSDDEVSNAKAPGQLGGKQAVGGFAKRDRGESQGETSPSGRKVSRTGAASSSRARSPSLHSRRALQRTAESMSRFSETDHSLHQASSSSSSAPEAGPSRTPSRRHTAAKQAAALRQSFGDLVAPTWDLPRSAPAEGDEAEAAAVKEEEDGGGELEDKWWKRVAQEEYLRSGVPGVQGMVQDFRRRRKKGIGSEKGKERASDAPTVSSAVQPNPLPTSSSLPLPPVTLASKMHQNIATLQTVRHAHRRLFDLTSTEPVDDPRLRLAPLARDAVADKDDATRERKRLNMEAERREVKPVDVVPGRTGGRKRIPRWAEVSRVEAAEGIKRTTGEVLSHVGFEGGSQAAVDTLTDLFADHLMNLGRTMRRYVDNHAKAMTPEELILHTLFENGTTEVSQLDRYIRDDVEARGVELEKLSTRLQKGWLDKVIDLPPVEDESIFTGDGTVFANNFVEDLGEDFFGLRQLGVDASSLSVPGRLFRGEEDDHRLTNGPFGPTLPYPPPPPFAPLSLSSIPSQIGLLRPFYQSRFQQLAILPSPPPTSIPLPPVPPVEVPPAPASASVNGATDDSSEPVPVAVVEPPALELPTPTPASPMLPETIPDDAFDAALLKRLGAQAEIPLSGSGGPKRKGEVDGDSPSGKRRKKTKEEGVGKGNWKRPMKDLLPSAPSESLPPPPPTGPEPPTPQSSDPSQPSQPSLNGSKKDKSTASTPLTTKTPLQTNGNHVAPAAAAKPVYVNGFAAGGVNGKGGAVEKRMKVEPL